MTIASPACATCWQWSIASARRVRQLAGYETISLVGISDPDVLAQLDAWIETFTGYLNERVEAVLGLEGHRYRFTLRC